MVGKRLNQLLAVGVIMGGVLAGCDVDTIDEVRHRPDASTTVPAVSTWMNKDPDGLTPRDMLAMRCVPTEIGPDDILRVTIEVEHGGEAAIIAPNGDWYPVSWPTLEGDAPSPLSSVYLRNSSSIAIPIGLAEGQDEAKRVRIFVQPGTYRLIVAEQLDIDMEDIVPQAYCHFNFQPGRKGKREPFDLKANGWTGLKQSAGGS